VEELTRLVRSHGGWQQAYPDAVFPGGFYNTVFTWPILTFGWELFMSAAMLDPGRFERVLDGFTEISMMVVQAHIKAEIPIFSTTPATRDGVDVVFVENVYDPDPADEQYETTILYLIRDHGHLRIETDCWTMGLFSLDTWRHVLRETGFEVHEGRYNAGVRSTRPSPASRQDESRTSRRRPALSHGSPE
jgi:hypothetical protein